MAAVAVCEPWRRHVWDSRHAIPGLRSPVPPAWVKRRVDPVSSSSCGAEISRRRGGRTYSTCRPSDDFCIAWNLPTLGAPCTSCNYARRTAVRGPFVQERMAARSLAARKYAPCRTGLPAGQPVHIPPEHRYDPRSTGPSSSIPPDTPPLHIDTCASRKKSQPWT